MALLDVQAALARLYTDPAFRARFFAAPGPVPGEELSLDPRDRAWLAALDPAQVERFAASLRRKRLGEARGYLPALAGVLGERLPAQFLAYCDAQGSACGPLEDAKAFAAFILAAPPPRPWFLPDLARCERLCLEVLHAPAGSGAPDPDPSTVTPGSYLRLTSRAAVATFDCDLERLYPLCVSGEAGGLIHPVHPVHLLIGKVRDAMRVRLKRINETTARLLAACDGSRPVAAIVDELAGDLRLSRADRDLFARECLAFLQPLLSADLLHLDPRV